MNIKYASAKLVLTAIHHIRLMGWKHPLWITANPRKPKLTGKEYHAVRQLLQPGDMLLTRSDGYVSTALVPGFWTHAAVFAEQNEGGDVVIHAVNDGVQAIDLVDFLREDYVAVVRPVYIHQEGYEHDGTLYSIAQQAVLRAQVQRGKHLQYDHLFNFIDAKRVSCTEMVSICYPTKNWGKRRWGRYTVVADDIYQYACTHANEFTILYDSRYT